MSAVAITCISEAVIYCPETGTFTWKIPSRYSKVMPGDLAGYQSSDGYWRLACNGERYQAHRVAWRIMTGEWPPKSIDHKNGCRSDNRWSNLRLATSSQNMANVAARGKYPKGGLRPDIFGSAPKGKEKAA